MDFLRKQILCTKIVNLIFLMFVIKCNLLTLYTINEIKIFILGGII